MINGIQQNLNGIKTQFSQNGVSKRQNINNLPKKVKKNNIRNVQLMTNEICFERVGVRVYGF